MSLTATDRRYDSLNNKYPRLSVAPLDVWANHSWVGCPPWWLPWSQEFLLVSDNKLLIFGKLENTCTIDKSPIWFCLSKSLDGLETAWPKAVTESPISRYILLDSWLIKVNSFQRTPTIEVCWKSFEVWVIDKLNIGQPDNIWTYGLWPASFRGV